MIFSFLITCCQQHSRIYVFKAESRAAGPVRRPAQGAGRLDRAGSELPWLAEPPGMAEPRLQRTGVRSQRGAGGAGPR